MSDTVVIEHETQQAVSAPTNNTAVALITYPVELAKVKELEAAYSGLTIAGIEDKKGLLAVDEARKDVKRLKVAVENRREELKSGALDYGRRVDAAARQLREPLEALEKLLAGRQKLITDEVDRLKREADEKLKAEKAAKLMARLQALKAINIVLIATEVERMTDEEFANFLARDRDDHEQRLADEAKEKQRQAEEAAEQRRERERLDEERRKLDAEREEFQKQQREQAEREAAEQRKIEEEKTRLAKAEADRLAAEYDARRQADEDRLKAEREETARVRAEQLKPDREKLISLALSVDELPIPTFSSQASDLVPQIRFALCVAGDRIRSLGNRLT
jgi:hypothetical protein